MPQLDLGRSTAEFALNTTLQNGILEHAKRYIDPAIPIMSKLQDDMFRLENAPYYRDAKRHQPFFEYYNPERGSHATPSEAQVHAVMAGAAFIYGAIHRVLPDVSAQMDRLAMAKSQDAAAVRLTRIARPEPGNEEAFLARARVAQTLARNARAALTVIQPEVAVQIQRVEQVLVPNGDVRPAFCVGAGLALTDAVFADFAVFEEQVNHGPERQWIPPTT